MFQQGFDVLFGLLSVFLMKKSSAEIVFNHIVLDIDEGKIIFMAR